MRITSKKVKSKSVAAKSVEPVTKAAVKKHAGKVIPPPPDRTASWEEQANYMDNYSFLEMEKSGHFKASKDTKFQKELAKSAAAQKSREQVNVSLEPEQFSKLQAIAKRKHLSPATLARCWLLERLFEDS